MLPEIFASWNPNRYHTLREMTFPRVAAIVAAAAGASVLVFWLLLIPAAFQLDSALAGLSGTTTITFDAKMEQTAPTYLVKNPDILFTTTQGDGWIVITPQSVTVKKYLFFGAHTYSWKEFSTLSSAPVQDIIVPLVIFLLPSLLFWSAAYILVAGLIGVFLYSLCAYFVVHARSYAITWGELAKVSLYATIPAVMVLAGLPIFRLGLPVLAVLALSAVLWLVFSLLGTTLLAEKHSPKAHKAKS